MCGRYTIIAKAVEIEKRFEIEVPDIYAPRYNAAPTQILPVITSEQPQGLSFFRWGLIPSWSRDFNIGSKLINARSETITEKASFKVAFKHRRCLVIGDGYYEWKQNSKRSKIPYRITLSNGALFTFAGLWETYHDSDNNQSIHTFTIVTTESTESTAHIHERMPVILNPDSEKIWLDQSSSESDCLNLLRPYPADQILFYPVSNRVNSVKNDDADLILETPAMDQSGNLSLFD